MPLGSMFFKPSTKTLHKTRTKIEMKAPTDINEAEYQIQHHWASGTGNFIMDKKATKREITDREKLESALNLE